MADMRSDMPCMFRGPRQLPKAITLSAMALSAVCALLAGCSTTRLNQHAVALSSSLAPVVTESSAAYRNAAALHDTRNGYEAVIAYKNKDASYNPRNAPVLLSEKDIQTRLAVLAALQVYSKSLIEITQGNDSPEMDKAAASVGSGLASLGNNLAPSIENVLGIQAAQPTTTTTTVTTVSASSSTTTSQTSSSTAPLLTPEDRNGISTAVDALEQVLAHRTIEKELPGKIVAMDPHIQDFCKVMATDIDALDGIEQRDYDRILDLEKQFILEDEQSNNLNPQAHRVEIMQLPKIARQQKEAHAKLMALRAALNNLAHTHHALAAEAQNNNPESLKDKLGELADDGSKLGTFYSSLPAS